MKKFFEDFDWELVGIAVRELLHAITLLTSGAAIAIGILSIQGYI